jgi:hypothetical protein
MGRAIHKAVTIAEILKRKLALHQINALSSVEMMDVYMPVEEGLDPVTSRRYVSCLQITLSRNSLDETHYGYQPPLTPEEMMMSSTASAHNSNSGPLHPHPQHMQQQQRYVVP